MIAIISASTRADRKSHHVAHSISEAIVQAGVQSKVIDLASVEITSYRFPISHETGITADVKAFGSELDLCKGVIFVSPEYNGGYTGALKNLIDICPKSYFSKKAIGISSVSSGGLAGMRGALQMQHLSLAVFGIPSPSMLLVPTVTQKYNEDGKMIDSSFRSKVDDFVNEYLWLYHKLK